MKSSLMRWTGALVLAGLVSATTAWAQGSGAGPLSEEAERVLGEVSNEDIDPPEQHYYRSNEWRLDLLEPHLDGLGGAIVGVGSDQNYTFAAMMRAKMVFIVDYDMRIRWVHGIYRALVTQSDSPEALIARFSEERQRETAKLLDEAFEDHPHRRRIVRYWKSRHAAWHAYLDRVRRNPRAEKRRTWLASQESYDWVKGLHENGRVVAFTGDLTGETTLRAVGDAAEELGLPVRLVYFSNAEQFFRYDEAFTKNMHALHTDERSLALRTVRRRGFDKAPGGRWHYVVHDFPDFLERLDSGRYGRSFGLMAALRAAGPPHFGTTGISTIDAEM